jgi:hypothetical protein
MLPPKRKVALGHDSPPATLAPRSDGSTEHESSRLTDVHRTFPVARSATSAIAERSNTSRESLRFSRCSPAIVDTLLGLGTLPQINSAAP